MVFVGALPLLFAAPAALRVDNVPLSGAARGGVARVVSSTRLRSTAVEDAPLALRDVVERSRETYRNLECGCYVARETPTITFQYTRPVSERDYEGAMSFEEELLAGASCDVYEKIRGTHDSSKPLLLYLPGLDGVGISAVQQFDDLSNAFEFWRMRVDQREDRSTFSELTTAVSKFVEDVAVRQNRKVILVGESFGGLLAPSVAMRLEAKFGKENPLTGMVLVNPATSFDNTNWSSIGPLLASLRHIDQDAEAGSQTLPSLYSVVGGVALSMTIPDSSQYRSIFDMITRTATTELEDVLASMRDGFGILADSESVCSLNCASRWILCVAATLTSLSLDLPAKVIEHRVTRWCNVGSQVVNPRFSKLNVPTLFIGGDEDKILPTKEEADRLVKLMPDCTSISVQDAGHFILDARFNLTEAIIESPFDPFKQKEDGKTYDPILDWKVPTDEEIREAAENRVKPLRDLVSPQFFSTGADGKRIAGLGKVPAPEGPLLFVANHQLIGLDLGENRI